MPLSIAIQSMLFQLSMFGLAPVNYDHDRLNWQQAIASSRWKELSQHARGHHFRQNQVSNDDGQKKKKNTHTHTPVRDAAGCRTTCFQAAVLIDHLVEGVLQIKHSLNSSRSYPAVAVPTASQMSDPKCGGRGGGLLSDPPSRKSCLCKVMLGSSSISRIPAG